MTKQNSDQFNKGQSWQMFDTIASSYDRLNYILSAGMLTFWRKTLVSEVPKHTHLNCLDCATGTGEVMFSIMDQRHFDIHSMKGLDLSKNMMAVGQDLVKKKSYAKNVSFHYASATKIPFEDNSFDCVSMVFGIRNVDDYKQCLSELYRVVKPNGKVLIMEFSLPNNMFLKTLYLFYFRHILPFIAGFFSGNFKAYKYLNQTVEDFPYGQDFINEMNKAGFSSSFSTLTFGIASLYTGLKNAGLKNG